MRIVPSVVVLYSDCKELRVIPTAGPHQEDYFCSQRFLPLILLSLGQLLSLHSINITTLIQPSSYYFSVDITFSFWHFFNFFCRLIYNIPQNLTKEITSDCLWDSNSNNFNYKHLKLGAIRPSTMDIYPHNTASY